jgi:hypothetical protein
MVIHKWLIETLLAEFPAKKVLPTNFDVLRVTLFETKKKLEKRSVARKEVGE